MSKKFDEKTIAAYIEWTKDTGSDELHKKMWKCLKKYLKKGEEDDKIAKGRLIVNLYRVVSDSGLRGK